VKFKRKIGLVVFLIPSIVLLVLLIFEISCARKEISVDSVAYREKSDISYKVQLKENGLPYEDAYLNENYSVIASLIKNLLVNYTYLNTFSSEIDYELKYDVTAELTVYDSNNDEKPIYMKEYTLIPEDKVSGRGIMAKLDLLDKEINYDEYNAIVEQFKKEVIPSATLKIKFNTNFTGTQKDANNDDIKFNSSKTSTLSVPISQKTINVEIKKYNSNKEETVNVPKKLGRTSLITITATVVLFIICSVNYLVYIVKSSRKKSKYELEVEKILREYDRAITESRGKLVISEDTHLIEVKDFMELLDVHDNFNIPIIFYRLSDDKCVFIIKYNNDIYYDLICNDECE